MLCTGCIKDRHPGMVVIRAVRWPDQHPLAPSEDLLRDYRGGRISWDQFRGRYLDQLAWTESHQPEELWKIIRMAQKREVVLVCYERGDEKTVSCHRRILAGVLRELAAGFHIII